MPTTTNTTQIAPPTKCLILLILTWLRPLTLLLHPLLGLILQGVIFLLPPLVSLITPLLSLGESHLPMNLGSLYLRAFLSNHWMETTGGPGPGLSGLS
jgi:hypothetical protein